MPTKDSATEMIYKILDSMTGIGINYDAKTNTITYNEPKTTIYGKATIGDNCCVNSVTDHKCNQCENWKQKEEEATMKNNTKSTLVHSPFAIRSVLSNRKKNAFSVVWMDGTTTVVHCQPGDEWDDEKALAMCFTKKALGNKGNFNDKFNDALDNKMKVIPADPAPEKACGCDGTCEKCECKVDPEVTTEAEKFIEEIEALKKRKNAFGVSKQTADELTKATIKADKSLKEMIDALTGETVAVDVKPVNIYKVFIRISGKSHYDSEHLTIESLRARVHEIAEELYGKKPYYYRSWMGDNGRMIIDFGHYTQFIEVEGITPSEYAKN